MPAPVLIQTSLILVPFQSIRNRFKLNANKPLKPHRGLRQRSGSAARGRGCSGQPSGARGLCHPIPGLPGDRAKVERVALGQRGPHEPQRSHHSGQLRGDRFIWGDHTKSACGAPELQWGRGHSRSPRCGLGGLLPVGCQLAAGTVPSSMEAWHGSPLALQAVLGLRHSRGGEPAPRRTPLLRGTQDLGGPLLSQRELLHPFQPVLQRRGPEDNAHLAKVRRQRVGDERGPRSTRPAPAAVPTGTPITQLLPNRT